MEPHSLFSIQWETLHGKPYFLFLDVLKRRSFQKDLAGTWSLLCYRKRWFFSLKILSYTLGEKWKMIFLKKIHRNMIFSSNFLKRWCFQNRPRWDMIFLVLSGKMVFYSRKHIFFLGRKWKMTFLRKYMEIWYVHVHVYKYGCYKGGATPLCQKLSKTILSRKNIPKDDWSSRLTA